MSEFDNKMITLSFNLNTSPGVYALLLGSGLSRAAGIPTGYEIVLDLIRTIAAMNHLEIVGDPYDWFNHHFGRTPSYDNILKELTTTQAERRNLLQKYIEPTPEGREAGERLPTLAHKAIAKLVSYNKIRMIITTNFDRLLEIALQDEGITPQVIYTEDQFLGAVPYIHVRDSCTIVKVHGDYVDSRIRNTPEELGNYSELMNEYLNSIFDNFGLIICGWSGEYDNALVAALNRRVNRRYTTFWTVRGRLSDKTKEIITFLDAMPIPIESADQFFSKLLENVEALQAYDRPHPLSPELAREKAKKFIGENNVIKLHDLINNEAERVYTSLSSDKFEIDTQILSSMGIDNKNKDFLLQRFRGYQENHQTIGNGNRGRFIF
jgi:hypothetical protein